MFWKGTVLPRRIPCQRATYSTATRPPHAQSPPVPRPYKSSPAYPPNDFEPPKEPSSVTGKKSALSQIWPSNSETSTASNAALQQTNRNTTSAIRRDDPRYKSKARRIVFAICAMTIVIGLTPELYQRMYGGKEQKQLGEDPKVERAAEIP